MSEKKRTISDMPWFKFFGGTYLPFVQVASAESAGLVFKAVCCYVCDKLEESPQLTDSLSQALFQSIKNDIDRSFESYLTQVAAGAKGGRPPKNPPFATLTHPNRSKPKQTEEEVEEESESEKELEKEREAEKTDKPPVVCCSAPTVEEVKAYCLERGNSIDPQRFVDYHQSIGWVKNGRPITDWKSVVNMWERWEKPKDTRNQIKTAADYGGYENEVFMSCKM